MRDPADNEGEDSPAVFQRKCGVEIQTQTPLQRWRRRRGSSQDTQALIYEVSVQRSQVKNKFESLKGLELLMIQVNSG